MWSIILLSLAMNVVAPAARSVVTLADEAQIVVLINQERVGRDMAPLRSDPSLVRAARRHALQMARDGRIWHTPVLHDAVRGWETLGENVAMATSARDVFTYFMGSPRHRTLILDPGFTHIGAGVTLTQGSRYVTVFFGSL